MAPPISIRRAWRTALLGAVSGIALASAGPALAAAIIVGTNSGTINGVGSGGTFNGTPFTTRLVGPVRQFLFAGDFIIDDNDEVIATGQRGASFFAANNAIIGTNVTFDFSAIGLSAGPGGSSPSFGGGGGAGRGGGAGGSAAGGDGGVGGPFTFSGGAQTGNNGAQGARGGGGSGSGASSPGQSSLGTLPGINNLSGVSGVAGGGVGPGFINNPPLGPLGGSGGAGGAPGTAGEAGGDGADATSIARNGRPGRIGSGGNGGRNERRSNIISGGGGGSGGGGDGGRGGGGGGAFEIAAKGRVTVGAGGDLNARGGLGTSGANGLSGDAVGVNLAGASGTAGSLPTTGNGGVSGNGGAGGSGAAGGSGGLSSGGAGGGAGAGGTVKLFGTIVDASGATADTSGGAGGDGGGGETPFGVNPDGGDGEDGRLIFSSNVAGGGATGVGTNPQSFDGQRGNNVFIKGADSTALIADLLGGADMFGLLAGIDANATDFDAIRAGAPGNARAALARFDLGPTGYSDDYIGFDMLLFINLLPTGLLNPMIGVDPLGQDAGFLESLRVGGVANDPLFGGSGPQVLASLGGLGVYGTLISQNGTIFNASADGGNGLAGVQLANGEHAYLTGFSSTGVPEPAGLPLFALGLAGLLLAARWRKRPAARGV